MPKSTEPFFTFFDSTDDEIQQNKENTAVNAKPLSYREHKKQLQERHAKAIYEAKAALGLLPMPHQKQPNRKKKPFNKM